jgi:hypothetical protein
MLVLFASASVRNLTLAEANRTSMTNTYCVYKMLRYYWWWTVELSQTCRELYQINLRSSVSVRILTLADANRTSMTNTYCMYTMLRYYWWGTVELSETCRVLYQINLRSSISVRILTLADANRTSMTNTYCVYTVLRYSWWWTVDLSETCRVLYQINLRHNASRWLSL